MPPRSAGRRAPGLRVVTVPGRASLYLRGSIGGRRIYESLGTDDPGLAEEARAVREAALYRAALHGAPAARRSFAEAVLGYAKDRQPGPGTRARLAKLVRHYGRAECDAIDQSRIDRAADAILRPGYAPATKLREIVTPSRAVLQWAAARGWRPAPIFERAAPAEGRTTWLTPAEAEEHIAAAEKHLRPLLTFLYCHGARLAEALELDWADVDLSHAHAVLRDTKNGRDRTIQPIAPRALAALAALPHRDGPVFRQRRGRVYADRQRLAGGQIRKGFAGALARAGITKPATPHSARHTWASWHYAVHKDLLLLKRDGDWRSVSQVERYAHLVPGGMADAIKAFWRAPAIVGAELVTQPPEAAKRR